MTASAGRLTHPSPNFGPRRGGVRPRLIVLHYTAMDSAAAALARLRDPAAEVSAHYLIAADGAVCSLVGEGMRAWHAGAGAWGGCSDVNSASIGIELDNDGQTPFGEPLMRALEDLLPGVMSRWAIPRQNIIGHSDCAPGRKTDPGPFFDWDRLAAKGLAARGGQDPGPRDPDFVSFRKLARDAGYTAEASDADLLAAVRLRWRPGAEGPLVAEDYVPLGHTALWT